MMNWLWGGMLVIGILFYCVSGDAAGAIDALMAGAADAVTLCVTLAGSYMLWMGLMNIAREASLIQKLARAVEKPLSKLFPKSRVAVAPVTLNLAANFFGMGSAATPFGLEAMRAMQTVNKTPDTATDDMCMFLALNSAAIELLPTGVLALRVSAGSADPYSVVVPTFLASLVSFAAAVISCKLLAKVSRK